MGVALVDLPGEGQAQASHVATEIGSREECCLAGLARELNKQG